MQSTIEIQCIPSCNPLHNIIYGLSNVTHLLELTDVPNTQTLETWSQSTRLQELERSFLRQIKWYVRQDLEAQHWSDSFRWLQSLTCQSHSWLALSPIYCIRLPFYINWPDAQHLFPKFILFSTRHSLHPMCFYYLPSTILLMCPKAWGLAVAVECIFSGAHNTISLWCASLKPETTYTLMLVKQLLYLA